MMIKLTILTLALVFTPTLTAQECAKPTTNTSSKAGKFEKTLRKHPRLEQELITRADIDGNGVLDKSERVAAKEIYKSDKDAIKSAIDQQRLDKKSELQEQRIGRKSKVREQRFDRKSGAREQCLDRTSKVREQRLERFDKNDDGKLAKKESKAAHRLHNRKDRNDDGNVTRGESPRQQSRHSEARERTHRKCHRGSVRARKNQKRHGSNDGQKRRR